MAISITDLSKDEEARAYWLWQDALDSKGTVSSILEFTDVWCRGDEYNRVAAGAYFLFAAYAWPAVVALCEEKGITRGEINFAVADQIKQIMNYGMHSDAEKDI